MITPTQVGDYVRVCWDHIPGNGGRPEVPASISQMAYRVTSINPDKTITVQFGRLRQTFRAVQKVM